MSQNLTNILTQVIGQVVSIGLVAFFWQFVQKKFDKVDDIDRRLHRLENRDEMRRDLGLDNHK